MYLFIETEIHDLPQKRFINCDHYDFKYIPRCVALSWQLFDTKQQMVSQQQFYITPKDYVLPEEIKRIGDIETEWLYVLGYEMPEVLDYFFKDLCKCQYLVGYQTWFDFKVIESEMNRYGKYAAHLRDKEIIDLNDGDVLRYCKVTFNHQKERYIHVQELYKYLFGKIYSKDLTSRLPLVADCFFELLRLKVLLNDEPTYEFIESKNDVVVGIYNQTIEVKNPNTHIWETLSISVCCDKKSPDYSRYKKPWDCECIDFDWLYLHSEFKKVLRRGIPEDCGSETLKTYDFFKELDDYDQTLAHYHLSDLLAFDFQQPANYKYRSLFAPDCLAIYLKGKHQHDATFQEILGPTFFKGIEVLKALGKPEEVRVVVYAIFMNETEIYRLCDS